jgi:hypothetical protein
VALLVLKAGAGLGDDHDERRILAALVHRRLAMSENALAQRRPARASHHRLRQKRALDASIDALWRVQSAAERQCFQRARAVLERAMVLEGWGDEAAERAHREARQILAWADRLANAADEGIRLEWLRLKRDYFAAAAGPWVSLADRRVALEAARALRDQADSDFDAYTGVLGAYVGAVVDQAQAATLAQQGDALLDEVETAMEAIDPACGEGAWERRRALFIRLLALYAERAPGCIAELVDEHLHALRANEPASADAVVRVARLALRRASAVIAEHGRGQGVDLRRLLDTV